MLPDPMTVREDQVIENLNPTAKEITFSRIGTYGTPGKDQTSLWVIPSSYDPETDPFAQAVVYLNPTMKMGHSWTPGTNGRVNRVFSLQTTFRDTEGKEHTMQVALTIRAPKLSPLISETGKRGEIELLLVNLLKQFAKEGRVVQWLDSQT